MKINRISPDSNNFLQILENIAKKPEKLYFIGSLPETRKPAIAIVGTRKPTSYGKEVTQTLAYDLAKRGIVVVSGLALGVDGLAHQAALEAGGTTIAVLANGLPDIYPATHTNLAKKMFENGGAIVSEYEPDSKARPYQFLERNRIVSGLSDGILITEAASRSGTLNTAMHALEQGKEVFVVPGNITSPMSAGCNALLKQGATPVSCAEDILEVIAPDLITAEPIDGSPLGRDNNEVILLALLKSGLRDGDELLRRSELPTTAFAQAITMLELNGAIKSLGANQWSLR